MNDDHLPVGDAANVSNDPVVARVPPEPGEQPESAAAPGASLVVMELDADGRISWAMECNGLPLIRRLGVENRSSAVLEHARLEITFADLATPVLLPIPRLEPQQSWAVENPNVVLNGSRLRSLSERERVTLTVRCLHEDRELARTEQPIDVLAGNEWDRGRLPELLAAFVTPNQPCIATLLQLARPTLERETGNAGFAGYSGRSRERVYAMTQAIYEGLSAFDLTYVPAPVSFEANGQKIRLVDELMRHRLGNCLDVSLAVAAALEQAGLHPVLILFQKHAVPGVWLVNEWLPLTVSDDQLIVDKLVRCGDLLLFEATAALQKPAPNFETAVQQAEERLHSSDRFEMILDVRAARLARLLPLPLRREVDDPVLAESMIQQHIGTSATGTVRESNHESGLPSLEAAPMFPRIEGWKERLLDLSLRNRLLHYRPSREKTVPLAVCELPELEDRLADGRQLILEPLPELSTVEPRAAELVVDRGGEKQFEVERRRLLEQDRLLTSLDEAELQRRCRAIFRQARTELEETGSSTLFLALGFLRWFESEQATSPRLAPILLYPVEILRPALRGRYVIRVRDDEPRLNDTLIEKLRREFQLDFTPLKTLPLDESGIDLATVLSLLRQVTARIPRFDVVDQSVLGFFSFAKFLMWRDLTANLDDLMRNELVRYMVEGQANRAFADQAFAEEGQLDTLYPPDQPPIVLDADSSQMTAIDAALRGNTFVLQGPPGTGKSQTIANMIAAVMATGRRVLFVAEKRAALEVVARRLRTVGLGDACLELHSNRASKRDVALELFRVYQLGPETDHADLTQVVSELTSDRQTLNAHAALMNAETALGPSHHALFGRLIAGCATDEAMGKERRPLSQGTLIPRPLDVNAATWRQWQQLIREAADAVLPFFPPEAHALRGCHLLEWTPALEREREQEMQRCSAAAAELVRRLDAVQTALGCRFQARVKHLRVLDRLLGILEHQSREGVAELLRRADVEKVLERLDQLLAWSVERETLWQSLETSFLPAMLDLDLVRLQREMLTYRDSFGPWRWWKLRGCWAELAAVARGPVADLPRMLTQIGTGIRLQELSRQIRSEEELLVTLLGPSLHQRLPNQREIATLVCSVREWRETGVSLPHDSLVFLPDPNGREPVERWRLSERSENSLLALPCARAAEYRRELGQIVSEFSECWARAMVGWRIRPVEVFQAEGDELIPAHLQTQAELWLKHVPALRDWSRWSRAVDAFEQAGLTGVVHRLALETVPVAMWEKRFELWLAQERLNALCASDRNVAEFAGRRHDRTVERFRADDCELITLCRRQLRARLAARRPAFGAAVSEFSEVGILQKEARRKRGHLPVRRLLERIPHLLGRLKPCLLMSPLSIAQYLPPGGEPFDLVIFDEASQIAVHDAIGAIARGRQVIVVGDSKQLPPTSFFQADAEGGGEDAVDLDAEQLLARDLESILEETAAALVPSLMLRWHYRSRDERLIAFSNHRYYDRRLQTFPAADRRAESGVSLIPVTGVFQRGGSRTNPAEAIAVVHAVVSHLRDENRRHLSLGVVTFNQPQQMLIEDLLDDARSQYPEIEPYFTERVPEPVFVKNLENVQGDERDVMLFSITYASDESGNVSMNFGPLNRSGGERRLNVAITRARHRLLVFSGLSPESIDLHRTSAIGVRHLRDFLRYAAGRDPEITVVSGDTGSATSLAPRENHLVAVIADFLRRHGYLVEERVGAARYRLDLAVRSPDDGRVLMGIETDGDAYGSPGTARDRERLRAEVLTQLGWKLCRLYVLDWLNHPEIEQKRLLALLQKARSETVPPEPPGANAQLVVEIAGPSNGGVPETAQGSSSPVTGVENGVENTAPSTHTSEEAQTPGLPPFVFLTTEKLGDADAFLRRDQNECLQQLLRRLTELEGPVHVDRVAKVLTQAYGMTRVGSRAAQRVDALVQEICAAGDVCNHDEFLWPPGLDPSLNLPPARAAAADGTTRPPEQIAPEEIAAAALHLLERSVSLPRSELVRHTAAIMGFRRLTPRTQPFFAAGIQVLLDRGLAEADGESVRLPRGAAPDQEHA
ncbi:MAG TPA: DUF3320 domain-containing protein [Candidatus Ozemobacteraceae bacterium]|nr:DUF3320 domain-containing protein [Candidatus Ozemobacteraceae bacterium]